MEFFQDINLIVIIGLIMFVFLVVKILISWKSKADKNYEKRVKVIEERINAIGGKVVKIEQTKKSDCPHHTEFKDDGSVYVCYRVNYMLNGEEKETWSVFNLMTNVIII